MDVPIHPSNLNKGFRWFNIHMGPTTLYQKKSPSLLQVNVVKDALEEYEGSGRNKRNDMVTAVLPRVALDMVSYSAYDTGTIEGSHLGLFSRALRFIKKQHRRTEGSPSNPVYVGEFGVSSMNTNWDDTMEKIKNVVNVAIAEGARYVVYWQIFDNVLNDVGKQFYQTDKCNYKAMEKGPVYDQKLIQGYFLIHPDKEFLRPPASYLKKMWNGNWTVAR